jgi:hypothetical protein
MRGKSMKNRILFVFVLFTALGIRGVSQTPVVAVQAFYHYDRSHSQNFTRQNIDARKQWFSGDLYKLFLYELKRQDDFFKSNPKDKPYFEGLPFQPIDELCKAEGRNLHKGLEVKAADENGDRATVTATFSFPKPCDDPDPTTYTLGLVKEKSGWVIDDVNYGEDRTLKEDLKRKDY